MPVTLSFKPEFNVFLSKHIQELSFFIKLSSLKYLSLKWKEKKILIGLNIIYQEKVKHFLSLKDMLDNTYHMTRSLQAESILQWFLIQILEIFHKQFM